MAFIIIRHASAGERGTWGNDDLDRPLDRRGEAQALGLVAVLAAYPLDRVLSSPALRCVQTVAPLASRRELEVEAADSLLEGAGDKADPLADSLWGAAVAVCTHGDIVPVLLDSAVRRRGFTIDAPRWEKGSCWVLDYATRTAEYLPPPV
ncbi:MAG TPA: phosphoglycerate mutase family protein [Acidimicrobiales bacterium]|nr:phosphoglycerate mutase family protein [Acidimicrobiales bacterium]